MLPTTNSMRQFLQVAVNLTSTTLIQQALTKLLPQKLKYVPKVTTNSNRITFTSQLYVLATVSDTILRARARVRSLQILPMVLFVNLMRTGDRAELAEKAATILFEAFEKELKDSGTIIVSAELRKMDKLVGAGHTLVGCINVGS